MAKFSVTMLACRGDLDRANVRLTRQQARRPMDEINEVLSAEGRIAVHPARGRSGSAPHRPAGARSGHPLATPVDT